MASRYASGHVPVPACGDGPNATPNIAQITNIAAASSMQSLPSPEDRRTKASSVGKFLHRTETKDGCCKPSAMELSNLVPKSRIRFFFPFSGGRLSVRCSLSMRTMHKPLGLEALAKP